MLTIKILALVAIVLGAACVALLFVVLSHLKRAGGGVDADTLQKTVNAALSDTLRHEVTDPLLRAERENAAANRAELQTELRGSRTETTASVQTSMERLGHTLRESQRETAELQSRRIAELSAADARFMAELTEAQNRRFEAQDKRLEEMQKALGAILTERMDGLNTSVTGRLSEIDRQFRDFREQSNAAQAETRRMMEERLTTMQTRNAEQLEKMRETVDEKLQKTLHGRISESFKLVNERLGDVYKGLGEMQALAGDVGDLKKVMSGVKTRGILGEIQLGAIMEEILSPDQYETNIATRPNSANRVEFAVRLPGEDGRPVYLPIDAKFPADAYHHVLDAYEVGDPDGIKAATTELSTRIKGCAKDIRDKYIEPPYTTTFGILFLPFEGLYAEVVRLGLVDVLQQQYRISVAGPTTLAALLNSLQMGFRTLAIQKRSSEVWEVLGAVKTEFATFEAGLMKAKSRIEQTGDELDLLIGRRTRQINRRLKSVSELPTDTAARIMGENTDENDENAD